MDYCAGPGKTKKTREPLIFLLVNKSVQWINIIAPAVNSRRRTLSKDCTGNCFASTILCYLSQIYISLCSVFTILFCFFNFSFFCLFQPPLLPPHGSHHWSNLPVRHMTKMVVFIPTTSPQYCNHRIKSNDKRFPLRPSWGGHPRVAAPAPPGPREDPAARVPLQADRPCLRASPAPSCHWKQGRTGAAC